MEDSETKIISKDIADAMYRGYGLDLKVGFVGIKGNNIFTRLLYRLEGKLR